MILLDLSGIFHAKANKLLKLNDGVFNDDEFRQMMLGSIAYLKSKFSNEYGRLVIAMDDKRHYWRSAIHPYYKWRRNEQKKKQKNDGVDWNHIYSVYNDFLDEIKTLFPYKVMLVDSCEADDIIAVLAQNIIEKTVIISRDHDFGQLHKYSWVSQYDPMSGSDIVCSDPEGYLWEHIIRGDAGDDIPNILSPINSFYIGQKQKSITKKMIAEWKGKTITEFADTTEILDRYYENESLVSLDKIPDQFKEEIIASFKNPVLGNNSNIQSYILEHGMVELMQNTQQLMEKI